MSPEVTVNNLFAIFSEVFGEPSLEIWRKINISAERNKNVLQLEADLCQHLGKKTRPFQN